MFWKKKSSPPDPLFTLDSSDQRMAFRVYPPEHQPLYFTAHGQRHRILDISAGGLSFVATIPDQPDRMTLSFALEEDADVITAGIEVVSIDTAGICHCRFSDIAPAAVDRLHRYVLKIQKEERRRSRTRSPEGRGTDRERERSTAGRPLENDSRTAAPEHVRSKK